LPFVFLVKTARMGTPDDERKWIQDSLAGDTNAYAVLIGRYQKMIHAVAFRMTGSMADSEDLAQETFMRAYEQLGSFRAESKFSTWLCRITVNACLNWRAREGRREAVHRKWAEDVLVQSDGAANTNADELTARVQAALNRLPAKQRAAIVLTVYEEMNHAEAARALGCSETTVSWRVFTARNKLKRWLK